MPPTSPKKTTPPAVGVTMKAVRWSFLHQKEAVNIFVQTYKKDVSPQLAKDLAKEPDLQTVTPLRQSEVHADGSDSFVTGVDPKLAPEVMNIEMLSGSPEGVSLGTLAERLELPVKGKLPGCESLLQQADELAAEDTGEDAHRQEESGAAWNPPVVRRQSAAGDDAVQVGVMGHSRAPGVQH